MLIVGFDIVATLIKRENRVRPQLGKTLDRRIAAWKQEVEQARMVFDICGNSYRLVVQFNYAAGVARIRFAGTHEEYDKIDVRSV